MIELQDEKLEIRSAKSETIFEIRISKFELCFEFRISRFELVRRLANETGGGKGIGLLRCASGK